MADLPSLTGRELIQLLKGDGWVEQRHGRHGIVLNKVVDGLLRTCVVPNKTRDLPSGTLSQILGPKQTGIGRAKLVEMVQARRRRTPRSRRR